ncbi:MAG: exodeoxyribonuclease VII small subunit [Chlorobiota bacterium]|nr:MAG: exodeoxyribonuclease VII small subunit [Chlorobiota bacterium]
MAKQTPTIDEQLRRLEEIRQQLEAADRPIEELVALYEEGMAIAKQLREQLTSIRQRIITIGGQTEQTDTAQPNGD